MVSRTIASVLIVLQGISTAIRQENEIKGVETGREEILSQTT